jgi:murein endopeptidase
MKNLILGAALITLSSCGGFNPFDPLGWFDDEDTGTPVRSLEEPVEDGEDLPTPAEAAHMEKPAGLVQFSSVGFYSRGKLWSHWRVEDNQFWTVRRSTIQQKMNYANFFLWEAMHEAAKSYFTKHPTAERLNIWDISHEFGGKRSGHVSHQNGTDFDTAYPLLDSRKPITLNNIDYEKSWSLAVSFVETGKVHRILTDRKIKLTLCEIANKAQTPESVKTRTLRALRPWKNHAKHFHIRFYCPKEDRLCVPQTEPPMGSGCDGL